MVMLIIQHNCGRRYENTVMVLEIAMNIGVGIMMLQKPFIRNRELSYSAFNLYWPQGDRTSIRDMMAVKRD